MTVDKLRRLSEIRDEVSELHPLLNRLLRKMPTVENVEYTHGPDEMGADFVLSRRHEVFGETEYVGVIAKVGKVLQDHRDIERQIDECWLARPVESGRKRVRLTEVWVAATGTVTKGAQEKLHEKYKNAQLHFMAGHRLVELIDEYIPDYWTDIQVEIGELLSDIRSRNAAMDRAASLVGNLGASFYVEQDVTRVVPRSYSPKRGKRAKRPKRQKPERVDFVTEVLKRRVVVLEGEMGSGKSKLLRHTVEHLSLPDVFLAEAAIPVLVTYKDFAESYDSNFDRVIGAHIPLETRHLLPEKARFVILIDGLDEMNISIEGQIGAVQAIVHDANSRTDVRVVLSTRYLNRMDPSRSVELGATRLELAPLRLGRVIDFLTQICSSLNAKGRILEDLKKSQLFRELPRSPIAAILLAQLLNDNAEELPSNLTELYAKYVELMLGRWDVAKGLQSQKEYEALDNILMSLATYVVEHELPVISVEEVQARFVEYLRERHLEINPEALLQRAVSRSEIIGLDPQTGVIAFKHRTFAEFLHAKHLYKSGHEPVGKRAFHPYWINVFFFYLGLRKDCPEILNGIIALEPASEAERVLKFINLANYMLAAYTTPYSVVTAGVIRGVREAAQFYRSLIEEGSDLAFARLPRMHALWLVQFLFRDAYSYTFFRSAFEEAALTLDAGDDPTALKAYALFMLNVAYLDAGGTDSFDFLLSRHLSDLPLDLALAVTAETRDSSVTTELLRRHERRLEKMIKADKSLRQQVDALFQRPIRLLQPGEPNGG